MCVFVEDSEEVGPGDEVMVEPVIINTATEPMYVFIEVDTPLMPKESTEALTSQLKMIEISNADLYYIDDINFTITGYGIDTENSVSDMQTVWEECKELR